MAIIDALRQLRGATYREPPEWLREALGASRTLAGVVVNERSAVQISTVYRCIYAIASTVASLPLFVYRRKERGKEKLANHPITTLLHDAPNEESTAMTLREALIAHAVSWGNGYAEIQRNGIGRPVALWLITPDRVTVRRRRTDARLEYAVKNDNGTETVLRPYDVLHIPGPGFDGVRGYSVLRLARESLGLAMASERFGAAFFGNGSHHSGVLEMDGTMKDDAAYERLRRSWQEVYGGVENAHRVAILEQGMKFKSITIPPEDAQFLETRKFSVEDLCRWFGVPPHKAGHLERSTNNNIEHQAIEWVTDTIRPWCVRSEQELKRKLFLVPERDLFAEHVIDGLLRGDFKTRMEGYGRGILDGHLTRNEARERENLDPIEGLDEPLVPLNMGRASDPAPDPKAPKDPREPTEPKEPLPGEKRARALLTDAAHRVARRETADLKAALQRLKASGDAQAFDVWAAEFSSRHTNYVVQQMHVDVGIAASYVQHGFELLEASNYVEKDLDGWTNLRMQELITLCEAFDE